MPAFGADTMVLGRVLGWNGRTRLGKESGQVNTDPVASARARAAARKDRAAAAGTTEAPAPEFAFAQPTDAAQAKLARDSERSSTGLLVALILVVLAVVAAITAAVIL